MIMLYYYLLKMEIKKIVQITSPWVWSIGHYTTRLEKYMLNELFREMRKRVRMKRQTMVNTLVSSHFRVHVLGRLLETQPLIQEMEGL